MKTWIITRMRSGVIVSQIAINSTLSSEKGSEFISVLTITLFQLFFSESLEGVVNISSSN